MNLLIYFHLWQSLNIQVHRLMNKYFTILDLLEIFKLNVYSISIDT